jgi:hypothetical protein
MSASVYGIKETKEALRFGLAVYVAGRNAIAKKQSLLTLLPVLVSLIGPAKEAIDGAHLIAKEASDLQSEEVDELLAMARPVLEDIVPDSWQMRMWKIIGGVRIVAEAFRLLK